MSHTDHKYSKSFSIVVLMGALLMWSETPLLAAPPQSSQSNTTAQGDTLPDAPQPQTAQAPPSQPPVTPPAGAAGAKAPQVKGSPVAQPAGAAVAPARQRGHRSLLIKVGLLAGTGIAVGSILALSQRSPARPPGASASVHP